MEIINSFVNDKNWNLVEEDSGAVPGRFLDPLRNKHITDLENKIYARSIALDCRTGQALPYKDDGGFFTRRTMRPNGLFDYRGETRFVDCHNAVISNSVIQT